MYWDAARDYSVFATEYQRKLDAVKKLAGIDFNLLKEILAFMGSSPKLRQGSMKRLVASVATLLKVHMGQMLTVETSSTYNSTHRVFPMTLIKKLLTFTEHNADHMNSILKALRSARENQAQDEAISELMKVLSSPLDITGDKAAELFTKCKGMRLGASCLSSLKLFRSHAPAVLAGIVANLVEGGMPLE